MKNESENRPWTKEEIAALSRVLETMERAMKDPATTNEQMLNVLACRKGRVS